MQDATVNIRKYGSKETEVIPANLFIESLAAEVKNYSRV